MGGQEDRLIASLEWLPPRSALIRIHEQGGSGSHYTWTVNVYPNPDNERQAVLIGASWLDDGDHKTHEDKERMLHAFRALKGVLDDSGFWGVKYERRDGKSSRWVEWFWKESA